MWGFVVTKVFDRRPQSTIDIKIIASYVATSIVPEIEVEIVKSFRKRVYLYYQMAGQHFQQNI